MDEAIETLEERLRQIQERCDNATGPELWSLGKFNLLHFWDDSGGYAQAEKNTDFVTASREDVPFLLQAVRALQRENESLRLQGDSLALQVARLQNRAEAWEQDALRIQRNSDYYKAKAERYRKALEFYADENNYDENGAPIRRHAADDVDCGQTAIEALIE